MLWEFGNFSRLYTATGGNFASGGNKFNFTGNPAGSYSDGLGVHIQRLVSQYHLGDGVWFDGVGGTNAFATVEDSCFQFNERGGGKIEISHQVRFRRCNMVGNGEDMVLANSSIGPEVIDCVGRDNGGGIRSVHFKQTGTNKWFTGGGIRGMQQSTRGWDGANSYRNPATSATRSTSRRRRTRSCRGRSAPTS